MKVNIADFETTAPMRSNVNDILRSGWLSPGLFVKEFEDKFAAYHKLQHAIMTNSGTSALIVALQALKELEEWDDGEEVICPAITFVATINAVIHTGLKPILVDINATDYCIDTTLIISAITDQTRAIIPVHAFGLTTDMFSIREIATAYDLKIVEDSCEALGATYTGARAGTIGDIGCFSFYMSHHVASGAGGMAITGNPWYARRMRSLINHGWDRKRAPMGATEFDFEEIRKRYYFKSIGYNFRATEVQAAIALPQLETLEENLQRRVDNAKILAAGLSKFSDKLQLPKCPYNRSHALMMYPIVLREGDKWDLIKHLETNGIETREMLPLTKQPCYEGMFNEDDYPVAKWINAQGFYVGCSQYLTSDHMGYVAEKFGEWFK